MVWTAIGIPCARVARKVASNPAALEPAETDDILVFKMSGDPRFFDKSGHQFP
jgi:hypothetical protein